MNTTHAAVLTPPGSSAIAVIAVRGPRAWRAVRRYFRTHHNQPLAETTPRSGFRFGRFGDGEADEVLLIVHHPQSLEIHCHGGRRVVDWLLDLLRSDGVATVAWTDLPESPFASPSAAALLPFARTVRTAAILLDQAHGAYDRAVAAIESNSADAGKFEEVLRRNAAVGRHLVEPWTVAIAGPPNAGKSTLMNALAGFSRSVVSNVPGTTRDAVAVSLAFDGWPVDVVDTAGLREAPDELEREGVDRARQAIANGDLCLWVVDVTGPHPAPVEKIAEELGKPVEKVLVVFNKCDLKSDAGDLVPGSIRISAVTGNGLSELAARISTMLVPDPPRPGEAVPFTPAQCDQWSRPQLGEPA